MKYFFHAFRNPWHLLTLMGGIIAGFFLHPLIFWPAFFAADAFVLFGFSTHKKFRRYVDSLEGAESEFYFLRQQRNAIGGGTREYREKLRKLDFNVLQIRRSFMGHGAAKAGRANNLTALSELESQYIRLLYNLMKQHEILEKGGSRATLEQELTSLKDELATTPANLAGPKRNRIEILEKRLKNAARALSNTEFIEEQLKMLDESFNLIYEESLQVSGLDAIAGRIDETLVRLSSVNDALREMENLPEFTAVDNLSSERLSVR